MSVALVTGAARGIGLEVARQLAARGDTTLLGARDLGRGEAAARELQGDVRVIELDVADAASVSRAGATISARHMVLGQYIGEQGDHDYDRFTALDAIGPTRFLAPAGRARDLASTTPSRPTTPARRRRRARS